MNPKPHQTDFKTHMNCTYDEQLQQLLYEIGPATLSQSLHAYKITA